jgi:TnpA family transposase
MRKREKKMAKVVVLLSPTQRAKLLQIPDTFSEREITRYYSLSVEDLAVIEQHRRPQNRLGFTVQLAYLRFPGRPWDPQEQVPPIHDHEGGTYLGTR